MMALDGKAIIKEEITDKDAYDAAAAAAAVAAGAALAMAAVQAAQVPPASSSSSSAGSASAAPAAVAAAAAASNNTSAAAATAAAISRRLKANSSGSSSSGGDKSSSSSSSSKDSSHTSSSRNDRERERERERDRLCRTPPDSPPDSSRSLAPRSPHSPLQLHQRPQRTSSVSPVVNGGGGGVGSSGTSPTPTPGGHHAASLAAAAAAAAAVAHVEQTRLVAKMRKFLGALVQFSQELGQPEVSERVRALVFSLCCGSISVEEFRLALQEAINLPLRPYVVPLLKNSIALVQREIVAMARATNQSALQYVTNNEQAVMEFTPHGVTSAEFGDIFIQLEAPTSNGGSGVFKRRSSDSMMEHGGHNGLQEWSEYMASGGAGYPPPPSKRLTLHPGHSVVYGDYGVSAEGLPSAAAFLQRDERDLRMSEAQARHPAPPQRAGNPNPNPNPNPNAAAQGAAGGAGGEEEWKNIHTMLNCISAMVDKTKRAITILQQRGIEPQHPNSGQEVTPAAMAELRRQTEEKVAEFKRNAEDAVTQVKRQAVIEIQRAVVAAETRAAEIMTQERLRMEKFFMEMSRHSSGERDLDNKSPSMTSSQNGSNLQQQCWNCGRKATETCSGCNMARYCSASCQYRDWDSHHQVCGNSRSTELSAKHLHSASSLRSAMATRSPPTPNSAVNLQAAAAAAAAGAREVISAASSVGVTGGVPVPGVAGGGGVSSGGGGANGGGGSSTAAGVAAATPGALVANGLGSK